MAIKEKIQIRFNTRNLSAPHGNETRYVNTRFIGNGKTLVVKTALHMVINGHGGVKGVVNDLKGPCRAI